MEARQAWRLLEEERTRLVALWSTLAIGLEHPDGASGAEPTVERSEEPSGLVEQERDASMLGAVEAALRDVDEAMDRVGSGAYGTSALCGDRIGDERLEAVPATWCCVLHEPLWEARLVATRRGDGGFASAEELLEREALSHLEEFELLADLADELELSAEGAADRAWDDVALEAVLVRG